MSLAELVEGTSRVDEIRILEDLIKPETRCQTLALLVDFGSTSFNGFEIALEIRSLNATIASSLFRRFKLPDPAFEFTKAFACRADRPGARRVDAGWEIALRGRTREAKAWIGPDQPKRNGETDPNPCDNYESRVD